MWIQTNIYQKWQTNIPTSPPFNMHARWTTYNNVEQWRMEFRCDLTLRFTEPAAEVEMLSNKILRLFFAVCLARRNFLLSAEVSLVNVGANIIELRFFLAKYWSYVVNLNTFGKIKLQIFNGCVFRFRRYSTAYEKHRFNKITLKEQSWFLVSIVNFYAITFIE